MPLFILVSAVLAYGITPAAVCSGAEGGTSGNSAERAMKEAIDALDDATERNDAKRLEECRNNFVKLVDAPGVAVNARGNQNLTPLHVAARLGYLETVKRLISNGAQVNAVDNFHQTPLAFAAARNHLGTTKFLLEAGADAKTVDDDGRTALHLAAAAGSADLIETLVAAGAKLGARTNASSQEETPLHVAAKHGNKAALEALLAHHADVNSKALNGWLPLHYAAFEEHANIVKILLAHKADVNARNEAHEHTRANGEILSGDQALPGRRPSPLRQTPLHEVALVGNQEIAKILLDAGSDVNARDRDGQTPLDLARVHEHDELGEFLRQCGGKSGKELPRRR